MTYFPKSSHRLCLNRHLDSPKYSGTHCPHCFEATRRMCEGILIKKRAHLKTAMVKRPVVLQMIQILKTQRTEIGRIPMEVTKDKILLVKTAQLKTVIRSVLVQMIKIFSWILRSQSLIYS